MNKEQYENVKNLPEDIFLQTILYELEHQQDILNSKQWLKDWYSKRLPVINKNDLQFFVDEGLKTPHHSQFRNIFELNPKPKLNNADGYYHASDSDSYVVFDNSDPSTMIHEFNHAILFFGGPHDMTYLFTNNPLHKTINHNTSYFSQPSEQHSRIMELRYRNKLDPTKTNYTIDDLKTLNASGSWLLIDDLKKGGMSDEDIINALNTWASSLTSPYLRKDGMYYAKSGGSIKTKKENKGKFAKVRDYVDYQNNK